MRSTGSGGRPSGASGRDPDYRLGASDRVRIIVFGQPTLTGEYTLDGNADELSHWAGQRATIAGTRSGDTIKVTSVARPR